LSIQSAKPSFDTLVVCIKIARSDWSGAVRVAALTSFAELASSYRSSTDFAESSLQPLLHLLDEFFRDADGATRVAAYRAVTRAAPTAASFKSLCAHLAVETEWRVRVGAFDAISSLDSGMNSEALATALCRDFGQTAFDDGLSAANFGGVLADGVEDPNEGVCVAAMRAVRALTSSSREYVVLTEVLRLASRVLRVGTATARIEALRLLAAGGCSPPLDFDCAAVVAEGMRLEESHDTIELICDVLRRRPCGSFRSFTVILLACESTLARARLEEDFDRSKLLLLAKEDFVNCNLQWAHVADLVRQPSDGLVAHWA
jgi:hypothetical protein